MICTHKLQLEKESWFALDKSNLDSK